MSNVPTRLSFPERFRAGELTLGLISFTQSEVIIEAMALAGLDFVIIDTEHVPTSLETVARLIRAADAAKISVLVRFAAVDRHKIQIVLDSGAVGIVISNVQCADEASALVRATRFQPIGDRGVCAMTRSGRFASDRWQEVMDVQDQAVLTIALIESPAGLENVEGITAVEGLDGVFLGPSDLSVSLGIPYQDFTHPEMLHALRRIVSAANRHGTRVVTTLSQRVDREYGATLVTEGVSTLCYSADNMIFYSACRDIVKLHDRGALTSA